MGLIARFALFLASPDIVRYASELVVSDGADYSFWALGPLIPPINPDAIQAAAAEPAPQPAGGPGAPQNPVPIAIVSVPTEGPPTPTPAPPTPTPSPSPSSAQASLPQAPASATPTRTVAPAQAPSVLPTSTIRPTSTPAAPTSTPVTRPEAPPTATTAPRQPSATPLPTGTPATLPTTPPVQPPPSTPSPTPTRAPTATPAPEDPPLISFASDTLVVGETTGGQATTASVEVVLSKTFSRPVSVRYATAPDTATSNVDFRPASGTLTFAPGVSTLSFPVSIISDALNEPNERFTITLSNPTDATLGAPTVMYVTITDSSAPPRVSFAAPTRTVAESVGSTAFTIQLSEPSALDVTVPYVVSGTADARDHSLRAGTIVIPAGSISARLRFAIVDDRIDEADESISVSLGTPTNAQLGPPSIYVVTITDDDTAGVTVEPTSFNLAEGGPGGIYTVVLESQPTGPVTVTVAPNAQMSASPAQLIFTSANWDKAQAVTITAVNDDVDEDGDGNATPHRGALLHTVVSPDPNYDGIAAADVTATITDNDTAGITITPAELPLSESVAAPNHAGQYTVRLTSEPTATVTITIANDAQVSVSLTTLTFTPANWRAAQTVTVTAVDDDIDEDGDGNATRHRSVLRHSVTSADGNYDGFAAASVTATITDNDTAGIAITPAGLALSESVAAPNHAGQYTVRLTSEPTATVTVALTPDAQLTINRATLTFTRANWGTPQAIIVTAVDDAIDEDGAQNTRPHQGFVRHTATSADPLYGRLPAATMTATIADNDTAGFRVAPPALLVSERASGAYSVRLTSEPTGPVTITLSAAPAGLATLDRAALSFTPLNWSVPQTVTVTPIDNDIDAPATQPDPTVTVSHGAASPDPLYNAVPVPTVPVTIADDDVAGVSVSPTALALSETPAAPNFTQTYAISLTSEPIAPVTITVAADDQVLVGTAPLSTTASLTFTAGNWRTPQIVTVQAIDDDFDEADSHTGVVGHTTASADPTYNARAVPPVNVTIADNDTAEVLLSATALALAEGGPGATYTVRLSSRPRGPVTITLTPDAQVTVSPTSLSFNGGSWDVPRTVTVTAEDDFVDEAASHTGVVRHSVTSGDASYNGLAVRDVTATIADNDTAGVTVSPTSLAVTEGGVVSYTLSLQSQPIANVTFTLAITPAGRIGVSAPSVSFAPGAWDVPQTVTVTALADDIDAPDATVTIGHTAASGDPNYSAIPTPPVVVAIADDDTAALALAPASISVAELITAPGRSAAYGVRLGSQPTAPVTVSLSFDAAQLTAGPAPIVFTATNWAVTQTVTVAAIDDMVLEGPMTRTITHTIASADGRYAALPPGVVAVSIVDDDQAGVVFTPAGLSLSESAAGAFPRSGAVGIALRSQPTAPVTITLSPDAQIGAAPTGLVFTPLSWGTPQSVVLTAVDDLIDEAAIHTGTLGLSLSSADPFYDRRAVPPYQVAIEDDDAAAIILTAATAPATTEAGGTVSFTVVLGSQPLAPVSLTPAIDMPGEAAVASPALPLVFDETNWGTPVTITVVGLDDTAYDGFVPFTVTFTATGDPTYAALPAAAIPSVALVNADDEPALAFVGDPLAALSEGDSGMRALRFPVTLGRPSPVAVTVSYETLDLSAIGGDDYAVAAGSLTFAPGQTADFIEVFVIGDGAYEEQELFAVRLTGATAAGDVAAVGDAQGVGRIRNDDLPAVRFAAADTLAREDGGLTPVAVRLDAPFTMTVTVRYTTIDGGALAGTATAGADYGSASGMLTFAPGETEQTIWLSILDDDAAPEEAYETVRLGLFSATGAPVGSPAVASLTIVEDGLVTPSAGPAFLSTSGPGASTTDGYGYTAAAAGAGSNFAQMTVPCAWPAGQPLTVELWSAAIHSGPGSFDSALGPVPAPPPGMTTFELYGPGVAASMGGLGPTADAAGSLASRSYPATGDPEEWAAFYTLADPVPCGRYLLRSSAEGADENQWAVRATGGAGVRFARLLSTVEQNSPAGVQVCSTTWLPVPAGAAQLRLRTFDLDGGAAGYDPAAAVTYYGPDEPFDPRGRSGGLSGAASGEAAWGEDVVGWPTAGWWRAVTCTSGRNRFVVEAAADGVLLPLYDEPPPGVPGLAAALTAPATAAAGDLITVAASYAVAGQAPARGVRLTVALPPELAFAGDPCAGAAAPCSATADTVTLAAGDLAAGQGGALSFTARVVAGAAGQLAAPRLLVRYGDELGNRLAVQAAAATAIR